MPLLTRLFIKSGLIFFLAALIIGVLTQIKTVQFPGMVPLFWHTLTVGWITQIIMGVSMWMFPGRIREENFSNQKWGWMAFLFLNIGLWLRVLAEPLLSISQNETWNMLLVISASFQFVGVSSYVLEIWPRVMSKKQKRQKRKSAN